MMWGQVWRLAGLLILVAVSVDSANVNWYKSRMGSFSLWVTVMLVSIAGMFWVVR